LLRWKKIADSFISISVGNEYGAEPITGLFSTITRVSLLIVAVLIQLKKLKFIEEMKLSVRRALDEQVSGLAVAEQFRHERCDCF